MAQADAENTKRKADNDFELDLTLSPTKKPKTAFAANIEAKKGRPAAYDEDLAPSRRSSSYANPYLPSKPGRATPRPSQPGTQSYSQRPNNNFRALADVKVPPADWTNPRPFVRHTNPQDAKGVKQLPKPPKSAAAGPAPTVKHEPTGSAAGGPSWGTRSGAVPFRAMDSWVGRPVTGSKNGAIRPPSATSPTPSPATGTYKPPTSSPFPNPAGLKHPSLIMLDYQLSNYITPNSKLMQCKSHWTGILAFAISQERDIHDLLRMARKRGDKQGDDMADGLEVKLVEASERRARAEEKLEKVEGVMRERGEVGEMIMRLDERVEGVVKGTGEVLDSRT